MAERPNNDQYLRHLEGLIQRGRLLRETLTTDPSSTSTLASNRIWQQDCALMISQLSGGSKAHWLARSFSQAFLMRSVDGRAVETAAATDIVERIVAVLKQAVVSLSQMADGQIAPSSPDEAPSPRRFDFVHNPELRPILEQAFAGGRRALEEGRFDEALFSFCGVLEAIVTDALEHSSPRAPASAGVPAGKITDWPFQTRLEVAAKLGLIHSGYSRLPPIAFSYRDIMGAGAEAGPDVNVSDRDARRTGQVLHVVMRDLDPGR